MAITYEVGSRNTKLRAGIRDSKQQVTDFRRHVKDQFRQMSADAKSASPDGKGLFSAVLKGNLAAQGLAKGTAAIRDGVNAVGEMVDASDQLGVSVETLGRLQRVMQGAGVSTENLRKSFLALNTQRQAALTGDENAIAKFAELGVSISDLQSKNLEETFFAVADGLTGISDEGARAQKVVDLLGTKQAKMIGEMAKGGAALKEQMARVTGAVSEAEARAVDAAADRLEDAASAVKGTITRKLGEAIEAGKEIVRLTKEDDGIEVRKGLLSRAAAIARGETPAPLPEPEKTKTEEEIKAEAADLKKLAEQKRTQAMRDQAQRKTDAENADKKDKAAAREVESERDRADTIRESFSATQRYALAVGELEEARRKYDATANASPEQHEAHADLAEKRAKFEKERAKQVERFALPLAERKQLEREDRKAEKASRKGERVFRGQERDRVDRDFRAGRIKKDERDRLLDELRIQKPKAAGNENIPADTLKEIQTIAKSVVDFGKKIGVLRG
jgi:hypothetical protein